MKPERLYEALLLVQSCASDSSRWPSALAAIVEVMNADTCVLFTYSDDGSQSKALLLDGVDDPTPEYQGRFWRTDPFRRPFVEAGNGNPLLTHLVVEMSDFERTEFYQAIWRPRSLYYGSLAGSSNFYSTGVDAVLAAFRGKSGEPFGQQELSVHSKILQHVELSLRQQRLFESANRFVGTMQLAFDGITDALVLIDQYGRVIWFNRAAETLFGRNLAVSLRNDRLSCWRHGDQVALDDLIRKCVFASIGRSTVTGANLFLAAPDNERAIVISGMPLCGARMCGLERVEDGAAILLMADPNSGPQADLAGLFRLLGLTPSEALLAKDLLVGRTLKDHAELSGIAHETARSRLKGLFAKTGTSRQGELIRHLAGYPCLRLCLPR